MALLKVENLRTYFHTRSGIVKAVDGISYEVERGQTVGIVGESGSGKSVSCYSLLGLIQVPPGRLESGTAIFGGTDLLNCDPATLRAIRGKRISMIFQDPMTCLNPYIRVGEQLIEPLLVHEKVSHAKARERGLQAMKDVGILDADRRFNQYPHQFSGGMRQRIMIAMALITEPELLIADEPTTALDVTVQAQILDLIKKLQVKTGTAVIFITHDLGIISGLADRVLVMYAGKIVEQGHTREIFYEAKHPYTRALLASIPSRNVGQGELYTIPGMPPDLVKPIPGCAFAPRCKDAQKEKCFSIRPEIVAITREHASACLRIQDGTLL